MVGQGRPGVGQQPEKRQEFARLFRAGSPSWMRPGGSGCAARRECPGEPAGTVTAADGRTHRRSRLALGG